MWRRLPICCRTGWTGSRCTSEQTGDRAPASVAAWDSPRYCGMRLLLLPYASQRGSFMTRMKIGTSIKGRLWCAAVIVVAGVIASGSLVLAQGSADRTARAIDQAQRAVRERIASQDSSRNVTVQFGPDARTESPSNTDVRVSGTGSAVRATDRMSRPFSYEAVVNTRNSNVSAIRYDWRGDWYNTGNGNGNGNGNGSGFGRGRGRGVVVESPDRHLPPQSRAQRRCRRDGTPRHKQPAGAGPGAPPHGHHAAPGGAGVAHHRAQRTHHDHRVVCGRPRHIRGRRP